MMTIRKLGEISAMFWESVANADRLSAIALTTREEKDIDAALNQTQYLNNLDVMEENGFIWINHPASARFFAETILQCPEDESNINFAKKTDQKLIVSKDDIFLFVNLLLNRIS